MRKVCPALVGWPKTGLLLAAKRSDAEARITSVLGEGAPVKGVGQYATFAYSTARSTKTLATILGSRRLDILVGSACNAAGAMMGCGRRTAIATIGIIDAGNGNPYTIAMTDREHQKFIDSILKKNNLSVEIPVFSSPQYVETISVFFKESTSAYWLLAMCMASRVIDESHRTRDYEPVILLSELIGLDLPTTCNKDLEVTAQEVRSALFWGFLRTGHKNLRLLDAECQLLAVMCGGSFKSLRLADAALTQGVHLIEQSTERKRR